MWLGDLAIENQLGAVLAAPGSADHPRLDPDLLLPAARRRGDRPPTRSHRDALSRGRPGPAAPVPAALATRVHGVVGVAVHDYELYSGDGDFARRMLPVVRRALGYYRGLDSNGLYSRRPAHELASVDAAAGEDTHTNAVIFRALLRRRGPRAALGTGRAAPRLPARPRGSRRRWSRTCGTRARARSSCNSARTRGATTPRTRRSRPCSTAIIGRARRAARCDFVDKHLDASSASANGQFDDDPYMSNYISPYIWSTELLARLQTGDTARRAAPHAAHVGLHAEGRARAHAVGEDGLRRPARRLRAAPEAPALRRPATSPPGEHVARPRLGRRAGPGPLGLRPRHPAGVTPGFRRWMVAPQPGGLRLAQGQAPTPHGPIVSRWRRGRATAPSG